MNLYKVVVMANCPVNNGEKDYSQEFTAYDTNGRACAIHYQSNNKIGNEFIFHVIEKMVKAATGTGAIFKFQKWQSAGLDEKYLVGEKEW